MTPRVDFCVNVHQCEKCSPTGNRQIMRINRCEQLLSVFVFSEEKKKKKDRPEITCGLFEASVFEVFSVCQV